jgi:hypothetical protein
MRSANRTRSIEDFPTTPVPSKPSKHDVRTAKEGLNDKSNDRCQDIACAPLHSFLRGSCLHLQYPASSRFSNVISGGFVYRIWLEPQPRFWLLCISISDLEISRRLHMSNLQRDLSPIGAGLGQTQICLAPVMITLLGHTTTKSWKTLGANCGDGKSCQVAVDPIIRRAAEPKHTCMKGRLEGPQTS